ncbi:alpha/beta fold hydrolase [Lysinibacillus sp. BW-2-10]|uniref:alpha/beta fold hydrolase n=1 Tax=Lysinibacillus sp. BW-2-10 TaxID=2590030 RepID=UPI00117E79DF|nr:alpha/beta hydrolase [Lysinibacillus sp. BW-2-10]TSI07871.1 alpha/beta hydrolase [Lysinibacillus sp. BW-2-10]
MERKIEIFQCEGMSIEYSIIGKGEPILVLHGGHSNCYEEFGYKHLVENGFSLITPSRAGYGRTSKAVGESLAVACTHYAKLLHQLNIEKVHVLAISAGGPSGLYFAANYPELVSTLTLQSAVTKKWLTPKDLTYQAARILFNPKTERLTWGLIAWMNNLFPRFIFRQMFPSFSKLNYREAGDIKQSDVEAIRRMNNRQRSGEGFFIDIKQANEIKRDHLRKISCPTLILHSQYDGSVSLEHPHYAHQHISSSTLYLLETWGHLIWLGHSSTMTDEKMMQFLKENEVEIKAL